LDRHLIAGRKAEREFALLRILSGSSFTTMATVAPRRTRLRFGRLSIAAYLGLGIGGLMFLAVASTLAISLYANWRNTTELLQDKSRLLLGSLIEHTERFLDPASVQADFVADLIERGELDPRDQDRLLDTLRSVLASTPQVHALVFFDPHGWQAVAARHRGRIQLAVERWTGDPQAADLMRRAEEHRSAAAYWGSPVYVRPAGTVLNLRRPVLRDSAFLGIAVAVVRVAELPRVSEVGDPVLFDIWRDGWEDRGLIAGSGHQGNVAGQDYIYLYAPLADYADAPWLVGSYFAEDAIATQFRRLVQAAVASLFGLVLAVASAFLFGRVLRGPIDQLGGAASAVRTLELDRVPALRRSWFRELDDAARAFNGMVAALRAFALYVPRRLVTTLIARGELAALPSEMREVTVLFTDIVAFTARTESMGAAATAEFLNHHFALVTACIEAEDGIIDKYIGDAVMALWGALESQADHAARAARAARAIARAVREDNAGRMPPVRMRMGMHSGPVVVGNIGTPTRMNYTVVGDTVNTAQRLENLAKELLPEADVAILLSESTASALPGEIPVHPLGTHQLRGIGGAARVFALSTMNGGGRAREGQNG
jgi:adenylate cyclase